MSTVSGVFRGYRGYDVQQQLYNNYVARDGKEAADTYSARPGHSEHQTGLAIDVNEPSSDFDGTAEAKWLAAHSEAERQAEKALKNRNERLYFAA